MLKFNQFVVILAGCIFLSGCLPEDKDPNSALSAERTSMNGVYATSLAQAAQAFHDYIITDPSWFANADNRVLTAAQLSTLGVSTSGLPFNIAGTVCRLPGDRGVLQLLWGSDKDNDGNFKSGRIGYDTSMMLSSLQSHLSADQAGIFLGNRRVQLASGRDLQMPDTCAITSVPKNAPVVATEILSPAAPSVEMSRTEYRTVACHNPDFAGTLVQRRTIVYKTDRTTTTSAWQDENVGNCLEMVSVNVAGTVEVSGVSEAIGQFAALGLRDILSNQVQDLACTDMTVTRVQQGNVAGRGSNNQAHITTCRTSDDLAPDTDDNSVVDTGTDNEEMRVSCRGTSSVVISPTVNGITGISGTCNITTEWKGIELGSFVTLVRTRDRVRDSGGNFVNVTRWVGKNPNGVQCEADESLRANCNQIDDRPTLRTASGNRWVTQELESAVTVRGTYGTNNGCAPTTGEPSDCANVSRISLERLNPDFFLSTEVIDARGTTVRNIVSATEWENRDALKPRITGRSSFTIPAATNQCEWYSKVMVADCPTGIETPEGRWNANASTLLLTATPYRTYNLSRPRIHFTDTYNNASLAVNAYTAALPMITRGGTTSNMYALLQQHMMAEVSAQYMALRGNGTIISELRRTYTRQGNAGQPNTVGTITMGLGQDAYYKGWNSGGVLDLNPYVLNAHALQLRQNMCNAGQATGRFAPLCTAGSGMSGATAVLTRELCNMPIVVPVGRHGVFTPGLTGQLKRYCEYIFEEWAYSTWKESDRRFYRYGLREMSDGSKSVDTTLLNRDGITTSLKPNITETRIPGTSNIPPQFTARVSVGIDRYVDAIHCARQESELVEIPVTVLYVSYWYDRSGWGGGGDNTAPPTIRGNTPEFNMTLGAMWKAKSGTSGYRHWYNYPIHMDTLGLFRRTQVREFYSDSRGWSHPRTIYYSEHFGTFTQAQLDAKLAADGGRLIIDKRRAHGGPQKSIYGDAHWLAVRRQELNPLPPVPSPGDFHCPPEDFPLSAVGYASVVDSRYVSLGRDDGYFVYSTRTALSIGGGNMMNFGTRPILGIQPISPGCRSCVGSSLYSWWEQGGGGGDGEDVARAVLGFNVDSPECIDAFEEACETHPDPGSVIGCRAGMQMSLQSMCEESGSLSSEECRDYKNYCDTYTAPMSGTLYGASLHYAGGSYQASVEAQDRARLNCSGFDLMKFECHANANYRPSNAQQRQDGNYYLGSRIYRGCSACTESSTAYYGLGCPGYVEPPRGDSGR